LPPPLFSPPERRGLRGGYSPAQPPSPFILSPLSPPGHPPFIKEGWGGFFSGITIPLASPL